MRRSRTTRLLRLAHFSDFHLGRTDLEHELSLMRGLIDHAIAAGAQHLLFGGDIVDHGNIEDCKALRAHLQARDFLSGERLSFVPGNHDIWPFGEDAIGEGALNWLVGNARSLATANAWPAQARYERLAALFRESFDGAAHLIPGDPFPAFKRVGPLGLALLDTTSNRGAFSSASGRFEPKEASWLEEAARRHEGPSLLLMHHWPFRVELAFDMESLPWLLRVPLETLGIDPSTFVDANFTELATVRRFIRHSSFDAVLCGHIHLMSSDVEDAEFDQQLGTVPVHCMGRSGGVHQDPDEAWLGYHLVDVDADGVAVETVLIEAAALS